MFAPLRYFIRVSLEALLRISRSELDGSLADAPSEAFLCIPRGRLNTLSTAGASEALHGLARGELVGSSADVPSEALLGLPRGRLIVGGLSEGVSSRGV
jgi:hypothetical protein